MIKKFAALLAGAMLMMAASAMATPLNPYLTRQVTINSAASGENSLQRELDNIYSPGVVDATKDQLGVGMFKVSTPGSDVIAPQFKFEWTANASTQSVGIFGWNGTTTVDAQLFAGVHNAGDVAFVIWDTSDTGSIVTVDNGNPIPIMSTSTFTGISKEFFGFYFQANPPNSSKYYSVDSLNPNGEARVLGFEPSLASAAFSYEDGTDFDFQDAGFIVESIAPVPEPGTMILLGAGLLGMAIFGKRRMNNA
jgi:hypothetical protein